MALPSTNIESIQISHEDWNGIGLKTIGKNGFHSDATDFDFVIRTFGGDHFPKRLNKTRYLTVTTAQVPYSADPRDLRTLIDKIFRFLDNNDTKKIAICCIETLLYWNDLEKVLWTLNEIDLLLKAKGIQGYIFIQENMISPYEFSRIIDKFT